MSFLDAVAGMFRMHVKPASFVLPGFGCEELVVPGTSLDSNVLLIAISQALFHHMSTIRVALSREEGSIDEDGGDHYCGGIKDKKWSEEFFLTYTLSGEYLRDGWFEASLVLDAEENKALLQSVYSQPQRPSHN